MSALRTSFWWDRSDRPAQLEAVIFSVDAVLAHPRADERLFADAVWNLHCAGIWIVAITAAHWPDVRRPLRELLGDGAVEVLVTGDDVSRPKPHPEVYRLALWQLGIRAADAVAVEDSAAGLRARAGRGTDHRGGYRSSGRLQRGDSRADQRPGRRAPLGARLPTHAARFTSPERLSQPSWPHAARTNSRTRAASA